MALWKKIALFTLVAVLVLGTRVFFLWRERNAPVADTHQEASMHLSADDIVQPRKLYIDDLKSARTLVGKTVWMQAGYELAYYPYTAHHIDFSRRGGLIASAQAMTITDIVPAKAPASTQRLVPLGTRQVFAIFSMPGDPGPYATAIGYEDGADSKYYCDDVFFYDDPHLLYKHWSPSVWRAIDTHQAEKGMNERQVAMALGMIQTSDSARIGDRTVHYTTDRKQWVVSFAKDAVTSATSADSTAP
ncbi:MAG TPA: hypothetical protein VGD62_08080 [Acidobacteriaceae bacterium]